MMESTFLDGNAAAGDLAGIFALDITSATSACGGCGRTFILAEAHAFLGGPGTVLRCPGCDHIVLRLVTTPTRNWLDLSGMTSLEMLTSG